MSQFAVDFRALATGSQALSAVGEAFQRGSAQAAGTPAAAGATAEAEDLLGRVLYALGGALGKAASELQEVSGQLTQTAAAYSQTEQALMAWQVPGGGG
ncbi:MAG TPA: hypothetical protein VMU95_17290 [Trebonia sp.]|nr:hypothetical protein [Trebonia sp.]